jgi:23S rRNA pseudouridine1911/1915/1917 synthase
MCKVIYEDNHLLIVEKPPNMLTQGDATGDDCLLDHMKRYVKRKYEKPGAVYLGCVHRLDRPVGGLVALARTGKAAARLSEQLRTHAMGREYLAVVRGADIAETGTLTDWLLKDENSGNVTRVPADTPGAQEATLAWTRLMADAAADRALLAIRLQTGRKHQIRVQLAGAGHAIVQDLRYGAGAPGEPIALWGALLSLTHPTKQERMTFVSFPQGTAFSPFTEAIRAYLAPYGDADGPADAPR